MVFNPPFYFYFFLFFYYYFLCFSHLGQIATVLPPTNEPRYDTSIDSRMPLSIESPTLCTIPQFLIRFGDFNTFLLHPLIKFPFPRRRFTIPLSSDNQQPATTLFQSMHGRVVLQHLKMLISHHRTRTQNTLQKKKKKNIERERGQTDFKKKKLEKGDGLTCNPKINLFSLHLNPSNPTPYSSAHVLCTICSILTISNRV